MRDVLKVKPPEKQLKAKTSRLKTKRIQ